MPTGGISVWLAATVGALAAGLGRIIAFIPALLGAIVILLIGWGIAKLIQALVTKGLNAMHFNELMEREGINSALKRADVQSRPASILGIIVYWFVFLFAINAAVGVLGIPVLTTLMTAVILYLPRIFAALFIIIIGAWGASLLGRLTRASATTAGITYGDVLGSIVTGTVLFFAFAMALDTLGLSFPFLTTAFAIIVGAVGLTLAIAFGLGGREYAADMLAGRQLRMIYRNGDRLVTSSVDGTVQDIRPTVTLVRTKTGDVAIQNSDLMRQQITRPNQGGQGSGGMQQAA